MRMEEDVRTIIDFDDAVVGDEHGLNLSQSIQFMIPEGRNGFFVFVFTNPQKGNDGILRSALRPFGSEGYLMAGETSTYQNNGQEDFSPYPAQGGLPEFTIIKLFAKSTNEDTVLTGQIIITLKRPNT